jgi:hypothetical protein
MFETLFLLYVAAILGCFFTAAVRPTLRKPLVGLGLVLTIPGLLYGGFLAFMVIAFVTGGAHIG